MKRRGRGGRYQSEDARREVLDREESEEERIRRMEFERGNRDDDRRTRDRRGEDYGDDDGRGSRDYRARDNRYARSASPPPADGGATGFNYAARTKSLSPKKLAIGGVVASAFDGVVRDRMADPRNLAPTPRGGGYGGGYRGGTPDRDVFSPDADEAQELDGAMAVEDGGGAEKRPIVLVTEEGGRARRVDRAAAAARPDSTEALRRQIEGMTVTGREGAIAPEMPPEDAAAEAEDEWWVLPTDRDTPATDPRSPRGSGSGFRRGGGGRW